MIPLKIPVSKRFPACLPQAGPGKTINRVDRDLFCFFSQMQKITVSATVNAPIATVRDSWNQPADIMKRAFASDDRHAPVATNDLRV